MKPQPSRGETALCYSLHQNQITDEGAKALAAAIEKSTSLRSIFLGYNPITDEGVNALAAAIEKSRCVTFVEVQDAFPTETGERAIATALRLRPSRRAVWALCGITADDRRAPIAHFLRNDGDHGALTRVLRFLFYVGA